MNVSVTHSMSAVRTPLVADWKIPTIRRENPCCEQSLIHLASVGNKNAIVGQQKQNEVKMPIQNLGAGICVVVIYLAQCIGG